MARAELQRPLRGIIPPPSTPPRLLIVSVTLRMQHVSAFCRIWSEVKRSTFHPTASSALSRRLSWAVGRPPD